MRPKPGKKSSSRVLALLAGVLVVSAAAIAQEGGVPGVRTQGDRFDLDATGMTLADLLHALGQDTSVTFTVRGDPSRVRVSDSFEGLELPRGLRRVLAPHSHVLIDHGQVGFVRHIELILLGAGSAQSPPTTAPGLRNEVARKPTEEPVDGLIAKAHSTAPAAERAAAVDAIAYRSGSEGVNGFADQFLAQMLSDPDEALRGRAIETLKDTADRVPFVALAQVAREDPSPALRLQALELLVERSENGEWREALQVALNDVDPALRNGARELVLDWHLDPIE